LRYLPQRRLLLAAGTVLVSVALLLWLADLRWIKDALGILAQADPWMLVPAVILIWLTFGIASERFRRVVFVLRLTAETRFPLFFAINLLTMFAAVVAPIGLAADVARAGLLPLVLRTSPGGAVLAVFQDKLLGVLGVMAVALPLLWLQTVFGIPLTYVWIQAGLYAICIVTTVVLHVMAPRSASEHPVLRRLLWFLQSCAEQLSTPRRFSAQLLLAVGSVLMLAAVFWCLGLAIGLPERSLTLMISVTPALYLAQSIPFTYAGWGAREATAIALLTPVPGIGPAEAVALSFAYGAVLTVAALPGVLVPAWLSWYQVMPKEGVDNGGAA